MLLGATTTFGDDLINIRVYNDTAEEIVVTVYDMNAKPQRAVLVRQIIDGFAWVPVLVTLGSERTGHVRWTAETTATSFRSCGHQERRGLTNDAMVRAFTDSTCVKSAP